jgi:protein O-mannosyl-transferase
VRDQSPAQAPLLPGETPRRAHALIDRPSRGSVVGAGVLIAFAAIVAYHNSVGGAFVLDDLESIAKNPTIRHLSTSLVPPSASGMTVAGRPLVNFTLALNRAINGENVFGYHLVNLAIHVLTALGLFGCLRRTLIGAGVDSQGVSASARSGTCERLVDSTKAAPLPLRGVGERFALAVAAITSVLWTVHPLATAAVTYVVQRAEALAALFFVLTLYAFIRSLQSARPRGWQVAAVLSCALGMATKETMVSAPLIVLLYDRAFAAGSFGRAWRARTGLYLGLAATWLLLVMLVGSTHGRGGSAGYATTLSVGSYLLTQFYAVPHYVRLALWPTPLVFDYGTGVVTDAARVLPGAAVVVALVGATVWALRRAPRMGFLGAVFLAVLAPSSSIVPIATQTMAEHRVYLPLAAAITAVVVAAVVIGGRRMVIGLVAAAVPWAALTVHRNEDYRSALSLWSDTTAKRPDSARAHTGLGIALTDLGRAGEAIGQFQVAIALDPNDPRAHANYGHALAALGRHDEAIREAERSLALRPGHADTLYNLGTSLAAVGREGEALVAFQQALLAAPDDAATHCSLADVLFELAARATPPNSAGIEEALGHYRRSLELNPDQTTAPNNFGTALRRLGRTNEAIEQFRRALVHDPANPEVQSNLGTAYAESGQFAAAEREFEQAVRARPQDPQLHFHLGNVLLQQNRLAEATAQFEETVRLRPDFPNALFNLSDALSRAGRRDDAIRALQRAVQLAPADPDAHNNLGVLLAEGGRLDEAIVEFAAVLKLQPDRSEARRNLELATQARQRARR